MELETRLFFEEGLLADMQTREYVINIIQNADPGSEFVGKNKAVLSLSQEAIQENLLALKQEGYEMIIFYQGSEIAGHIAYQNISKGDNPQWGVFHMYLRPQVRGSIPFSQIAKKLIDYASKKGVKKVRFGKNERSLARRVNRILESM